MAGGKRWSQEENRTLEDLVKQGLSIEEILKSGKFPNRTARSIDAQIKRLSIVSQSEKIIVPQISGVNILSLEEVLKRFSDAFMKICETQELDKLALERFKVVFGAAKDYGPILAHFERMSVVEREIESLKKMVEELRAQVSARGPEDQA